jgi:nuclear transport factor 2 (NTF2) superfamily protein
MSVESKPPFPPFTLETAQRKVKAAQDLWNTKYIIIRLAGHIPISAWLLVTNNVA